LQHQINSVLQTMKIKLTIILLCILIPGSSMFGQKLFGSLDSLLIYTQQKSTTLKSGELKYDQAKKAKLAAVWGITDFSGNVTLNVTDNTRLPVSLFPAEVFGGTPGTFQQVQTGIQYTNNFSQYGELKLINPQGWYNYGLAKINIDFTQTDNRLNEKTLYENIAATYYNILTLQEQLQSNQKNLAAADTLLMIVTAKFAQGQVNRQDVNDAEVNKLNMAETGRQIEFQINQQYLALKVLCDIPEQEQIRITQKAELNEVPASVRPVYNPLAENSWKLREQSARQSYKQYSSALYPSLSLVGSNSYQQFSNEFSLFDPNVDWIKSNYIGAKLVWHIPTANTLTQISKSKYDYRLAQLNTQHYTLKAQTDLTQLSVEEQKQRSQFTTNKTVLALRDDTYRRNLENYKVGIIGLDQLLNSFNALVSSEYACVSACIGVLHVQSKIIINNTIQ
jgi:outer membrane protein TolC